MAISILPIAVVAPHGPLREGLAALAASLRPDQPVFIYSGLGAALAGPRVALALIDAELLADDGPDLGALRALWPDCRLLILADEPSWLWAALSGGARILRKGCRADEIAAAAEGLLGVSLLCQGAA